MKKIPFNQVKELVVDYLAKVLEDNKSGIPEEEWEESLEPEIESLKAAQKATCLQELLNAWYIDEEDGEDNIIQTQFLLELIVENS